jgi:hypothetical protein
LGRKTIFARGPDKKIISGNLILQITADQGTTSGSALPVIRWRTWLAASILVLVDGFWLGQGGLSALVLLWQAVVGLPRWMLTHDPGLKAFRLRRMVIYVCVATAAVAFMALDIHVAAQRAQTVVQALKIYNAQHGRYPERLEDLVPGTLPALPRARLALSSDTYYFRIDKEGKMPKFGYTVVAPFGRMMYDFEALRWNALD